MAGDTEVHPGGPFLNSGPISQVWEFFPLIKDQLAPKTNKVRGACAPLNCGLALPKRLRRRFSDTELPIQALQIIKSLLICSYNIFTDTIDQSRHGAGQSGSTKSHQIAAIKKDGGQRGIDRAGV